MSFSDVVTRSEASALIPVELSREIIAAATKDSVAMRLGRPARMATHQKTQPVLSILPQAHFVEEGGLKATSLAAWEGLMLTAEEIATIVPIHQSVFNDASFNMWNELKGPIAQAVALKLDGACLMGVDKPDSWPESVLEGAIAAGHAVDTGATAEEGGAYGDLERVLGPVEDDGFEVNQYVAAPRLRRKLRQARTTIGEWLGETEGATTSAWDIPINYTPTVTGQHLALAGDWKMLIVAIREDINWYVSVDGVITDETGKVTLNLLQQDSVALRVVFRAAVAVANPATTENPDKATRYPFAILSDPESGDGQAAVAEAAPERQPRRVAGKR